MPGHVRHAPPVLNVPFPPFRAEGAIGTRRFFAHCSDASFPLRVTQQGRVRAWGQGALACAAGAELLLFYQHLLFQIKRS